MKLHLDPMATTCRPLALFLNEHDLAVEQAVVSLFAGEQHGADFRALNPNGTVPVFEDGDLLLTESSSILKHLAELAGSPAYPADLRRRARVNDWMDWLATGLAIDFAWGFVYPQVLRELHGASDGAVQAALLARGAERSARRFAVLDAQLSRPGHDFILGSSLTLADYQGACIASLGELITFDFSPYPDVARWLRAMRARPSWDESNAAFYGWRSALALKSPA